MTTLQARQQSERDFHDRQAIGRARTFAAAPERLVVHADDYARHAGWVRPALDLLDVRPGERVLDYGCGHGTAAVVFAQLGARASAFDLSSAYVEEVRARAAANRVTVHAVAAAAEALPFADASFDAVWGNAVLHHVELPVAMRELRRVLRPGGRAVFCEPWGGNPLATLARRFLPYPAKDRTRDERPLNRRDLAGIRDHFPRLTTAGFELASGLRRLHPAFRRLEVLDRWAVRCVPGAKNFGRYLVIGLTRD